MTFRRFRDICIDCSDPAKLGAFWAEALGYEVNRWNDEQRAEIVAEGDDPDEMVYIRDPAGVLPRVWLNKVPEPKTVKNRVHLDVNCTDDADRERLVALGATVVQEHPYWVVMADPEGN